MGGNDTLTFFHAPNTRSTGVRVLLEELGAPYRLHPLNMKAGEQRQPAYLAVNPMGKVPAILHRGALVAEQSAVYQYLGDLFPKAGLAPAIDDPLRGPYLRWFAFYGSCFEPAVVDRALKREPGLAAMSPYGDFDTMLNALVDQVRGGPYMLGERFTAADVLWGHGLNWTMLFKVVPELPELRAYADRVVGRPASQRAVAADAELEAEQKAATPTSP